MTTTFFIKGF